MQHNEPKKEVQKRMKLSPPLKPDNSFLQNSEEQVLEKTFLLKICGIIKLMLPNKLKHIA